MAKQVIITESEYNVLKYKADKFESIDRKLAECYDENNDQEVDLADIGEFLAQEFGYL